ncbi:MAG TPA: hypothetical protein VKE74_27970, partial [Gemmataceae bacterium]|nr:hypothetical protein [Gemmataceae bacterium]
MSEPPNDEPRSDVVPEPDEPGLEGSDSVQALHKPHMDIMNDPVMGLTGEDEEYDERAADRT